MPELKITPFLWFDGQIEEAAEFYVSVFGGKITSRSYYTAAGPQPEGTPMVVTFTIGNQEVSILNGGSHFKLDEAFSFWVKCEDQAEIDRYWDLLTANGGAGSQCGWLKDRFGVSWQLVPKPLISMLEDKDRPRAARVMQAVFGMTKLDIAALDRAYKG